MPEKLYRGYSIRTILVVVRVDRKHSGIGTVTIKRKSVEKRGGRLVRNPLGGSLKRRTRNMRSALKFDSGNKIRLM